MGRSITPVTPEFLRTVPLSASIYDQKLDRHFDVHTQGGRLYQSEYQLDPDGKEVFRNTHAIEWIVGADANGIGALIRRGDYIFEAPLSYYEKTGVWGLSPGYQRGDYGFSRVVVPGCINCHSGRPQPVAATEGKYENPPFSQLAIGCENCHGPGAAHVHAMGEGESYAKGKDPTIVNPGNLAPALANDICMSCHQTGDTRVFQPGKSYQDFRPGMPLDRVMAILMVPPTRENPPREDHVEHYYSMSMSKCFRVSANRPDEKQMRCITCHDPHIEPTAAEAPAFFNGKCMSCHTAQSCKEPAETRQHTGSVKDNCIGCHMQKREGIAISHTSITNHRIMRQPNEPFPDTAFEQTTAALPDLIHLNRVSGESAPPPAVTLLQAYWQLKGQSPVYAASYLRTLQELEKTEPENAIVQAALGHKALSDGRLDQAAVHLNESLRLNPAQPAVYAVLAEVANKRGQAAEAVALAQKAVALDPFNAALRKTLVQSLIHAKQYSDAQAAMEKYLEDFPEDDFMRKMLAIAKEP
jgi:Flp pilus assembly protein TadD